MLASWQHEPDARGAAISSGLVCGLEGLPLSARVLSVAGDHPRLHERRALVASFRESLIGWGFTWLVIVPCAALAMSVRASPAGIRPLFRDLIPWTSIVAASRRGTVLRYEAMVGVSGATVAKSLRLSGGLTTALREWLPADHLVVRALKSAARSIHVPLVAQWLTSRGVARRRERRSLDGF